MFHYFPLLFGPLFDHALVLFVLVLALVFGFVFESLFASASSSNYHFFGCAQTGTHAESIGPANAFRVVFKFHILQPAKHGPRYLKSQVLKSQKSSESGLQGRWKVR